jgi:flagellar basal-body rod protein FlgF
MDNAGYVALTRQSGLMREMQIVANNIANLSTTGFRKEGVVFAEHVLSPRGEEPSLSMASAEGRVVNLSQGVLEKTGGSLDFAIEGDGFFQIATPRGNELTRAGSFVLSPEGILVTAEGFPVLDGGASPISLPVGAGPISLSRDGTLSAGGTPLAQLGLYRPLEPATLVHTGGTRFRTDGEIEPVENGSIFQGFLEGSNVNAIQEVTRMIEVQRAYEMGQGFLQAEDSRIRAVIQTLGR